MKKHLLSVRFIREKNGIEYATWVGLFAYHVANDLCPRFYIYIWLVHKDRLVFCVNT